MEATFETRRDLTAWADDHTGSEIVAFYNGIAGVKPVKKFECRAIAERRIWDALHVRADGVETINAGASTAVSAKGKRKATKKVAARGKGKRPPKTSSEGGRSQEVLALVSRAKGVTLAELMVTFQWLPHTARGFMSRLGDAHKIESFKAEDGARTYRLVSK